MFDSWAPATKSGVAVTQETALTHTALYACVKVLGESIASLPVNLFRKTSIGAESMDTDNRSILVASEPSELYHSFDFRNTMMLHLALHGNAYALIVRNGNRAPIELRIINSLAVTPFLTPDGALYYNVNGVSLPYPAKDIIHLKGMSADGIIGKSPIETFRETIALGIATTNTQGSLWKNGTLINGYLKHPMKMTQDEGQRLMASWSSRFSGSDNAGKTPVLENGLEFVPLSLKPADAMFLETAKLSRNDICSIYRVPPHMIGDLERSTNNNIEHQSLEFVRNTLMPYLKMWENELNRKLLFANEKARMYFRFNVDGMLRGDTKSRAEYYTRALGSVSTPGWLTQNEVRSLENLDKVDDADVIYNPTMNQQTDASSDPSEGQNTTEDGTDTTDNEEPADATD